MKKVLMLVTMFCLVTTLGFAQTISEPSVNALVNSDQTASTDTVRADKHKKKKAKHPRKHHKKAEKKEEKKNDTATVK